jgi:hypothetical protein
MMKREILKLALAIALLTTVVVSLMFSIKRDSLAEIRNLARSGAGEQELMAKVEKSSAPFKLSADELIALKKDGVPDSVIVALLRHRRGKDVVTQP